MANQSAGIQINEQQMQGVQALLRDIRNGAEKAMITAINKTATTTKVQIKKRVGEYLNLKAARIDEDLTIDKATSGNISGKVRAKGEPIGLINFAGSQLKAGVKVKVLRAGSQKLIKHAFRSTKSGKEHLFWRKWTGTRKPVKTNFKYGRLPKKFRLPMERLSGPRIEDILAKPEIIDPIQDEAGDLLANNLDAAVVEILRRAAL